MAYNASNVFLVQRSFGEFHVADYIVFSIFMCLSLGVGVFFSLWGGKQKSTVEYLMGDRQMGPIQIGISVAVSYVSALTLVGVPAEVYINGYMLAYNGVGIVFGFFLFTFFFTKIFFPLKLTSPNEYLKYRYQSAVVSVFGNIFSTLATCLYMGFCMYAPAIALSRATNGRLSVFAAFVIGGAVGIVYTTIGGLKAVVWTDVLQSGFMLIGMVTVLIVSFARAGGFLSVMETAAEFGRLHSPELSFDPRVRHTLWGVLVYGIFMWGNASVTPAMVQRMCSLKSWSAAKITLAVATPTIMLLFLLSNLAGLSIFSFYVGRGCDIHAAGWTSSGNEIAPYFVMDQLNYPPFPGLFIAAMYAGSLSTLSSGLSAVSATVYKDILRPYIFKNMSDSAGARASKLLALIFGIVSITVGYLSMLSGQLIYQISSAFVGAVTGPYMGLFFLGTLFVRANARGALVGGTGGLLTSFAMNMINFIHPVSRPNLPTNVTSCLGGTDGNYSHVTLFDAQTDSGSSVPVYQLSYVWVQFAGCLVTIVLGLLVSLCTGQGEEVKAMYLYRWKRVATEEKEGDDCDSPL